MKKEGKTSFRNAISGLLKKEAESIEIWAVSLHSFSTLTEWERLLSVFGPAERERILRLSREEDRLRRTASHLLVSTLLGEKLELRYRELPFKREDYGKPYLGLEHAPFFNASHSGSLTVCALADHAVGIDMERCEPLEIESVRMLLGRFGGLPSNERERQEDLRFFYTRWTMLESWLKAEGTGLHEKYPLSSFIPEWDGACFRVHAQDSRRPPWAIDTLEIQLPEQLPYALAVCRRPQEISASEVGWLAGDNLVRRFLMLL